MDSLPEDSGAGPLAVLSRFRLDFRACLTARGDELCELADAVLCTDGPVRTLAGLSLAPEHRRGHGALYDAVNHGRVDIARLRRSLAGLPLPRAADGRLVLAADVSNWLRPGAATSPERLFCHVYGRGKGQAQMIPGWPYSVIAALEPGRTSWTAVLDAVRLGPDDDETEVTAAQVREVVIRLIEAGHWRQGDQPVLVVFDAGYDVTRLSYLLADLPVELLGRLRSDRVMQLPAPPRQPGTVGRPRKHGCELALADPATWPAPPITTSTMTSRYGTAVTAAWDRAHPRLTHRAAWLGHDGPLPVIEGTLIRLTVDHLPGDRDPKPVWLWFSRTGAAPDEVDRLWQAFLRRFDLEHTFRLFLMTILDQHLTRADNATQSVLRKSLRYAKYPGAHWGCWPCDLHRAGLDARVIANPPRFSLYTCTGRSHGPKGPCSLGRFWTFPIRPIPSCSAGRQTW